MKKVFFLVFIFVISFPLLAEGNKKLLLGFESEILAYNNVSYETNGIKSKTHNVSFLLGTPKIGLNLGFILNKSSILGFNFGFGYVHSESYDDPAGNNDKEHQVTFKLMPFYEFMFTSSSLRPFIKAGFVCRIQRVGDYDDRKQLLWTLGGSFSGGVHIFFGDSFSVDFGAMLEYHGGKLTISSSPSEIELDVRQMSLGAFFGLTGWI